MKRVVLFLAFILGCFFITAQVPQGLNYQTNVHNPSIGNAVIVNSPILNKNGEKSSTYYSAYPVFPDIKTNSSNSFKTVQEIKALSEIKHEGFVDINSLYLKAEKKKYEDNSVKGSPRSVVEDSYEFTLPDDSTLVGKVLMNYEENENLTLISYYQWNSTDSIYIGESRFVYEFDSAKNKTLEALYYWDVNENEWNGSEKKTFEYDIQGNLTITRYYLWDNLRDQWILDNSRKLVNEYGYNEHGKMILWASYSIFSYLGFASDTSGIKKFEYDYDSAGYQKLFIEYDCYQHLDWVRVKKEETTYEKNYDREIKLIYFASIADTTWWLYSRNVSEFNEQDKITLYKYFFFDHNDSLWIDYGRRDYIYNSSGKLIADMFYVWDTLSKTWYGTEKMEYLYDANGNDTLTKYYDWSQENEWVFYFRERKAFDAACNLSMVEMCQWDTFSNSWTGVLKYESVYNENNQEVLFTAYEWNTDLKAWIVDSKRYVSNFDWLLSGNALLSHLSVDQYDLIPSFDSLVFNYNVAILPSTHIVPDVKAIPADSCSRIRITIASDLSSQDQAKRTTVIKVTAEDQVTWHIYKILFSYLTLSESPARDDIKIYPNPFVNDITIVIPPPITSEYSITLIDESGKVVKMVKSQLSYINIHCEDLNPGIYILHLKNNENRIRKVLVHK